MVIVAAEWLPRIRQAVLVTHDLEPTVDRLSRYFHRWVSVPEPFRDANVGVFGLRNAVFAIGDSFLEVLEPVKPDTAVGRHLDRRGGDAGYMVMLQVADMMATRQRLTDLSVQVVWHVELPDAVDLHLHPRDVPGALVAVDAMDPPGSWRWGGEAFTGAARTVGPGGLKGLTLAVDDPDAAAKRWADVAGLPQPAGHTIMLGGGRQAIEFMPASPEAIGLVAIRFALAGIDERQDDLTIGSVRIEVHPLKGKAHE
jgi:hypothetical protein